MGDKNLSTEVRELISGGGPPYDTKKVMAWFNRVAPAMLTNLEVLEEAFAEHNPEDPPMTATANIQKKLNEWSTARLFTAQDDELVTAKKYYANGLDGLLAAITKAAIEDGMDRQTLMKLFLRHADEVSNG
jgi:hypothetical protein